MAAEKITRANDELLNVPNEPIIPFIIGDGIGPDIWKAASRVVDAAVEKAYNGEKRIEWKEVLAGQKAYDETGEWLPQETLDTIKEYLIAIKGPLTTPIGGGIRSLNVALRQELIYLLVFVQYVGLKVYLHQLNVLKMLIWLSSVKILRIFMQELNLKKEQKKLKKLLTSYKMKWVLQIFVFPKLLVLVLNQFLKKEQSV